MWRLTTQSRRTLGVLSLTTLLALPLGDGVQAENPKPVEVVNTPLDITGDVQVGNSSANPVKVRDVDRVSRIPFQASCTGVTACSLDVAGSGLMVIEYLTMEIVIQDPSQPIQTFVQTTQNSVTKSHAFVPVRTGATAANFGVYAVSQMVRLYADAFNIPSPVHGAVINTSGVGPTSFFMSIAGYQTGCGPGPGCPLP